MKIENIVKKLGKQEYEVEYGKFKYWDGISFVKLKNGNKLFLASTYNNKLNSYGINETFKFEDIQLAIQKFMNSNYENFDFSMNDYLYQNEYAYQ